MEIFYKIIGILGLIFIILGTFKISVGKKTKKGVFYTLLLIGGIFLTIYSIYIKDTIFIILQTAYILVVIYNIIKLKNK